MQGSRILLVDRDAAELAELAGALRDRGLSVSLASGAQMACERAKVGAYDVVVATQKVAEPDDGSLGVLDALSVELSQMPPLIVLVEGEADGANDGRIPRTDVERLVRRVGELARPATEQPAKTPSIVPFSHSLERARLGELLVVLATERRSGTLTVTTARGSGEVRLVDGDIADAVYVRLEGKKAIARLLSERDGTATFVPGSPAIMRRLDLPTRALVDEARAHAARADDLRERAEAMATGTLVVADGAVSDGDEATEVDQHVLARLRVPATLDELLDELPHTDEAILESALALHARGRIKQLGHSARVQLCGAEQLHLVRASAARAKTAGFSGPARVVFAATPARLAVLGHTVLSLADAVGPSDPAPPLPVPHPLSTLRLGDGVDLEIVALPLVPAYAPLWPMTLAGAAVVVRLDEGASQPLEEACGSAGVTILDARAVFGAVDESSPVQVATLVRTALEVDPRAHG